MASSPAAAAGAAPAAGPPPSSFNHFDARYHRCLCCCEIHVATLAKILLALAAVSYFFSGIGAIGKDHLPTALVQLAFFAVHFFAVLKENRICLILIICFTGFALVVSALASFLSLVILILGRADLLTTQIAPDSDMEGSDAAVWCIVLMSCALTLLIGVWYFSVLLAYDRYLLDKERAGRVPVLYEVRAGTVQTAPPAAGHNITPPPGPPAPYPAAAIREQKVTETAHLTYPRDASEAEAASASAPHAPPPAYADLEKNEFPLEGKV